MSTHSHKDTIILSLGGSLIVPNKIDTVFIKRFTTMIKKQVKKGKKFIIICGGGRLAREYQGAASKVTRLTRDDLDWLGIHATRLNAHMLRTVFRSEAHPRIITDPIKDPIPRGSSIIIGAGWRPGCSTDYDAVLMAKRFGAKTMINLSNIKYVYDKDPNKFKDAKRLKELSWKEFREQFGSEWHPGLNSPFDPVASKLAEKLKMKVIIAEGKGLKNIENIMDGKKYKGTTIQ